MKNKLNKLLGFRSGIPWKKIVAVLYYLSCVAFLGIGMLTPPLIPADLRDTMIFKSSTGVLFLGMISPAIFLSDTSIRKKLPFFKDRIGMRSVVGMMIVTVILLYLFQTVESFHSVEYKKVFNEYITGSFEGFVEVGNSK